MAQSGILMLIMLTSLLIGTAIAQSPSPAPSHPLRPRMQPPVAAPIALTPSAAAPFPPKPSAAAPSPSPSSGGMMPTPHHRAPAPSPASGESPSVAPSPATTSPSSSIANPPGSEAPAPNAAVSNRFTLGTVAVGLLVLSLVA